MQPWPQSTLLPPSALTDVLRPYVDRRELAGAVALAATAECVLSLDVVGYADVATRHPMAADTVFWIASQTKAMTAAAVMMLVDEGRLALDDPIERHLPEFRGLMYIAEQDDDHLLLRAPERPITVRQALCHTAGLRFSSPVEQPTLDRWPLADAVHSYAMMPLDFAPGTRYQYSNVGINTAARVLEVVAGQSYESFLAERLLDPLGMVDTTFWPSEAQVARLATAYGPDAASGGLHEQRITFLGYPLSDRAKRFAIPGGGLFSTAADCLAFCRMLLADGEHGGRRLLSRQAVAAMTHKQTEPAVPDAYGLGLAVGDGWYGHGGALGTHMTVYPRAGLITVYLVQHGAYPGNGAQAHDDYRQAALALPR